MACCPRLLGSPPMGRTPLDRSRCPAPPCTAPRAGAGPPGRAPPSFSALAVSGPTLFGMTASGGAGGVGTIFRVNTDGTGCGLLHSFDAAAGDGWQPAGSLTLSGSTLYGMTRQGGGGAGTIFKIQT